MKASVRQVRASVECSAAGPWGLTGVIEGIMVEQSKHSVQGYLDFCVRHVAGMLHVRCPSPGLLGF